MELFECYKINMTEDERNFFQSCAGHDWYYGQSDDLEVYQDGRDAEKRLVEEAKTSPVKSIIYDLHFCKFFGPGSNFNPSSTPVLKEIPVNCSFARNSLLSMLARVKSI